VVKGIPDLYDNICLDLTNDENKFIDWFLEPSMNLSSGIICSTVAWYVKRDRWYLDEADYDPITEENSTWYAKKYEKKYPVSNSSNVMKYFRLEKDERLITTNGKERPVILLKYATDSWWNPVNTAQHEKSWLCIPIFSYKDRHSQEYVLNEQCLKNPVSFYIPSFYNTNPGINTESSARFQAIQMVKEEHLTPLKRLCVDHEPQMGRPFGLTKTGLELLMYHFYDQFNLFPELEQANTQYSLFKEEVDKRIKLHN
jgi:hypothetical protein